MAVLCFLAILAALGFIAGMAHVLNPGSSGSDAITTAVESGIAATALGS
jgi:hypothetical protein